MNQARQYLRLEGLKAATGTFLVDPEKNPELSPVRVGLQSPMEGRDVPPGSTVALWSFAAATEATKATTAPDLSGIAGSKVLPRLQEHGLTSMVVTEVTTTGSAIADDTVRTQFPRPGQEVYEGTAVHVELGAPPKSAPIRLARKILPASRSPGIEAAWAMGSGSPGPAPTPEQLAMLPDSARAVTLASPAPRAVEPPTPSPGDPAAPLSTPAPSPTPAPTAPPTPAPSPEPTPAPTSPPTPVPTVTAAPEPRGSVKIVARPGGATVRVDGKEVELPGDGVLSLAPGAHEISFQLGRHQDRIERVVVERDEVTEVTVALQRSTGRLVLGLSPSDAHVLIDDALVSPESGGYPVPWGLHRLKVEREGFQPFEEELLVEEGSTLEKSVQLEALPEEIPAHVAILSIESTPPGAKILTKKWHEERTPATLEMKPGGYELRLRLEGYQDWVQEWIDLKGGKKLEIKADMIPATASASPESPATAPPAEGPPAPAATPVRRPHPYLRNPGR